MKHIISFLVIIFGLTLVSCNRDKAISDLYNQLKETRDSLYLYKQKYKEIKQTKDRELIKELY